MKENPKPNSSLEGSAQGTLLSRLFDPDMAESEMRRGTDMASNYFAPSGEWCAQVTRFIDELEPGTVFTADSVVSVFGLPTEANGAVRCNNAVGGLLMRLARDGTIRAVGYTKSERVSSRGRCVRVWERCR